MPYHTKLQHIERYSQFSTGQKCPIHQSVGIYNGAIDSNGKPRRASVCEGMSEMRGVTQEIRNQSTTNKFSTTSKDVEYTKYTVMLLYLNERISTAVTLG